MNLLLITEKEASGKTFTVTGGRAVHVSCVLHAKPGDTVKTGVVNGGIGNARLLEVKKDSFTAETPAFSEEPPSPSKIMLAVALPRPQSFKKTLHFAVSAGIKKIVFFHSSRVEKSYWNSRDLAPERIASETMEALEQGVDTVLPEITFVRSLREFLEKTDILFPDAAQKIIAHPVENGCNAPLKKGVTTVLAIGPEGGFLPFEVEAFSAAGYSAHAFGKHILRVEFACAYIAGALE